MISLSYGKIFIFVFLYHVARPSKVMKYKWFE